MNRLLLAYRVHANVVGVLLVILVFVGIPLNHLADQPVVSQVVAPLHGYLYLVYVIVSFLLSRRLQLPMARTALVLLAGLVPFLTFVVERRLGRDVTAGTLVDATAGSPGRGSARLRVGISPAPGPGTGDIPTLNMVRG